MWRERWPKWPIVEASRSLSSQTHFLFLVHLTRWEVTGNYLLLSNLGGSVRHQVTCDPDWSPVGTHTCERTHTHTQTHTHAYLGKQQQANVRRFITLLIWSFIMSQRGQTQRQTHIYVYVGAACVCVCVCVCVCTCLCWNERAHCFVFLSILIWFPTPLRQTESVSTLAPVSKQVVSLYSKYQIFFSETN